MRLGEAAMANKQASSNKINLILIGCHVGCYLAGTAEIGSSFPHILFCAFSILSLSLSLSLSF